MLVDVRNSVVFVRLFGMFMWLSGMVLFMSCFFLLSGWFL